MKKHHIFIILLAIFAGLWACSGVSENEKKESLTSAVSYTLPDKIDYNFHVKPILSDRCFACHGPDGKNREADLALHTAEGLFRKSEYDSTKYVVVAGDPEHSELYQRLVAHDKGLVMPPPESNLKLEEYEIAILKKWIEQGATWKKHWAFIPPSKPNLPAGETSAIDYFTSKKRKEKNIKANGKADPATLLRRLSFDTRGIPPSQEEIAEFVESPSPELYAAKIDQYLASSHHAEKMTSWWLDIARYADTHGYQDDLEREMWPWRDWVIHAFQENYPYDKFVTWQLAGDLLPNANLETILATGFNRNHKITQEGGAIPEEFLAEYVIDRTGTTYTAFQGLTMECARCHDHKYDPLLQSDFYRTYDFFNHVPEKGLVDYGSFPEPKLEISDKDLSEILSFINAKDAKLPLQPMVMKDEPGLRKSYILDRGQYDAPSTEVTCGTPAAILPFETDLDQNRLGLANWMFKPENPLTARVISNRIWQIYFGRGIVGSVDDFGNQGDMPSHPELLDWISVFMPENNWDMRALEREILLSETYQLDSKITPEQIEKDSENIYLARASRYRLSAETIRDQALLVSGLLVDEVGGPPVKPYQPAGLWAEKTSGGGYTTYVEDEGDDLYRKSLYTYWKRTVPPPSMLLFDAPTRDVCTVKRQRTSTPLQALALLNDPQHLEAAKVFAANLLETDSTDQNRIEEAFTRATSRPPTTEETKLLVDYFQSELQRFTTEISEADSLLSVGKYIVSNAPEKAKWAAMTMVTNTLLNLDETISRQ